VAYGRTSSATTTATSPTSRTPAATRTGGSTCSIWTPASTSWSPRRTACTPRCSGTTAGTPRRCCSASTPTTRSCTTCGASTSPRASWSRRWRTPGFLGWLIDSDLPCAAVSRWSPTARSSGCVARRELGAVPHRRTRRRRQHRPVRLRARRQATAAGDLARRQRRAPGVARLRDRGPYGRRRGRGVRRVRRCAPPGDARAAGRRVHQGAQEIVVLDDAIARDIERLQGPRRRRARHRPRRAQRPRWIVSLAPSDGPCATTPTTATSGEATYLFAHNAGSRGHVLAPMEPFSFVARDGLTVHGYVTFPVGVARQRCRRCCLVHGGRGCATPGATAT
jgi:hypothetical protein